MQKRLLLVIILFIFFISFFSGGKAHAENAGVSNNNDLSDSIRNMQGIILSQTPDPGKESSEGPEKDAEEKDNESSSIKPLIIKGTREKKRKKTDIQSISRQTMTADDIKAVPASFGDSVSALASLPGIIHAYGGLFGPLVIRGADPSANNYFIDDIPMDSPLHFGGLHSVINTNLMKDIDVYSSAFPAEFGSATAAVINISTVDEVYEFGGYTDLSLLSASALIKSPILKDKSGNLIVDTPSHSESEADTENAGYFIGSGRYGYIALAIKAAELITGDEIPVSPEYWDYQVKGKYKIGSVNSITVLLFGHKDYIRVLIKESLLEEGDDPLFTDASLSSDTMSHSHGLYLDSKFAGDFSNRLMYYGALPETHQYLNFAAEEAASWAKDINQYYRPWVFGFKDKARLKWMNGHSELIGGAEYTYYYFSVKGKFLLSSGNIDVFDLGNEEAITAYQLDETIKNHKLSGYLENKLTFSGLTLLPGIRSEYLDRTGQTTFDPRLMTSYKFPTNTSISAAGGHYSYFIQTNPNYFNQDPDISAIDNKKIKPEQAWHSAFGIEQEIGLFTFKMEGFKNYFYDLAQSYPHTEADGTELQGLCSGKSKTRGFEIMIRKDTRENQDGAFGWLSYTYTDSSMKSGLPTEAGYAGVPGNPVGDIYGDKWIRSYFEQRHNIKLVAGYTLGNHTFGGKFQYYSGSPYTPISGSFEDPDYPGRYVPITGYRNAENFPAYYQLDLRYTHKTNHSWGYISWYVEIINVFMTKDYEYKWYWDRPYSAGSNPIMRKAKEGLSFLPNFGVEVKF